MKTHYLLILFCLFVLNNCFSQKNKDNYIVEYKKYNHGKLIDINNPIALIANKNESFTTSNNRLKKADRSFPFEDYYMDINKDKFYYISQISPKERITYIENISLSNNELIIGKQTKKILGYKCKKATITINSDHYELWFTNDLPIKGSPVDIGYKQGLVLEITKNKNYKIVASKINKNIVFNIGSHVSINNIPVYDKLNYREKVWLASFIKIPVFEEEIINLSDSPKYNNEILRFANGTIIAKKIQIPNYKPGSRVFVDLIEQSNGDALARTGSVFIIPNWDEISLLNILDKGIDHLPKFISNSNTYRGFIITPQYTPPIELMRFFTPFGIGKFNNVKIKNKEWHSHSSYRQDITAFAPLLKNNEVYIGVYIGNSDKGGHKITANISIHPSKISTPEYTFIMPLFNTTNVMEADGQEFATMFNSYKGLTVEFELQNDVKDAKLRYIITGHGKWINGDEFNPKENKILLDGIKIHTQIPWREDCGSYRLLNPASEVFKDGLALSDLSRSNWCPGTVTTPTYIELGDLSAGKHKLQIMIDQGMPENKKISYWNVSGTIFGYE